MNPVARWLAAAVVGLAASGPAWCDQWSGYLTPVGAHVEDDGNAPVLFLMTSQPVVNPANCSSTDGYEMKDQVIINANYATILAAISAGQQISVLVSSTACVNGRPEAETVEIGQN